VTLTAIRDTLRHSQTDMRRRDSERRRLLQCPHTHDGAKFTQALRERWPQTPVVGCTTAGEFSDGAGGEGGISAVAFPPEAVPHTYSALADFSDGVEAGIAGAVDRLEEQCGSALRDLDPERWIGFVLIDGLHGSEEAANIALGDAAPFMSFVGGSAGDNLEFAQPRVFCDGRETDNGAVLLLCESAVPFTVFKTCSFTPTSHEWSITRADEASRTVFEVNGEPILSAYAGALGVTPESLDASVFMAHPVGIMIDEAPWIRSPQQQLEDGGLKFYCSILEGMDVHVMDSTDLVGDTRDAFAAAREELGGTVSGAVLFNCILRRLELDALGKNDEFRAIFDGVPAAGFHTYGESWVGHINQTLTGVLFG